MTQPYRIIDLSSFSGLQFGIPTGNEIAEISAAGAASYQIPLAVLSQSRNPRIINAGGSYTVGASDYGDVLVTTTAGVTITLPSTALRNGVPVSIIAAVATTPNVTIAPFSGQTILGSSSSLSIINPYGAFTLWPLSSTTDWYQK